MIVAVDANVLISDHLTAGVCRRVMQHLSDHDTIALSEYILTEMSDKLHQKFKLPAATAARLAMEHRNDEAIMVVVPATVPENACADRKDLPVLGTAVAAGAAILITGDHHLLDLKTYRGINILSPRKFLDLTAT